MQVHASVLSPCLWRSILLFRIFTISVMSIKTAHKPSLQNISILVLGLVENRSAICDLSSSSLPLVKGRIQSPIFASQKAREITLAQDLKTKNKKH